MGMTEGIAARDVTTARDHGPMGEWRRRTGAAMDGARLAGCDESLDAELYAILAALRTAARRGRSRRCLILSDSESALEMVERAWGKGVRGGGRGGGRAALLHAVNEERGKLELAVFVWNPAHAGSSTSAAADAAAKAHLVAQPEEHGQWVSEHLPKGRYVQTVMAEGREAVWHTTRFAAMQAGVGWWVRRGEAERERGGRVARWDRLGPAWGQRSEQGWEAVWRGTGARAPSVQEAGTADAEAAREQNAREAEEDEREGVRTGRWRSADPEEEAHDRNRCGTAMAARARALGEPGTGAQTQGCPACCSRARGWRWARDVGNEGRGAQGWDEERDMQRGEWVRGGTGKGKRDATLRHVLCGECEGVPEEARREAKQAVAAHMRAAMKAVTRREDLVMTDDAQLDGVAMLASLLEEFVDGVEGTASASPFFEGVDAGVLSVEPDFHGITP